MTNKTLKRVTNDWVNLSYDGKGINDAGNEYCPRIATFTQEALMNGSAKVLGHMFEEAPNMLAALKWCEQVYGADWPQDAAIRNTIKRAEGSE